MTFPASQQLLVEGLLQARSRASSIKLVVSRQRTAAQAGPLSRETLIAVMSKLTDAIDLWASVRELPGIAQYAKDQFDDPALDIAAEFTAMEAAAIDLRDWIFTDFPTASGAWLVHSYNNKGESIDLTFTVSQLAEFVIKSNTLIATIS